MKPSLTPAFTTRPEAPSPQQPPCPAVADRHNQRVTKVFLWLVAVSCAGPVFRYNTGEQWRWKTSSQGPSPAL
jgi:hypothetical protein